MQHFKKSDLMPVSEPASQQVALLQDLPPSPRREPSGLATSELLRLQHAVSKRHNEWAEVTQFVSTAEGDGCAQVAYDLGWISAAWLGKRVLFIDGTAMRLPTTAGTAQQASGRSRSIAPIMLPLDLKAIESGLTKVAGLPLYQVSLGGPPSASEVPPAISHVSDVLAALRRSFDLIVIASPPTRRGAFGVLLSRFVDNNVLVVRSGSTRKTAADEAAETIRTAGGNVTGIVLTRHNNPVPRWLRWF